MAKGYKLEGGLGIEAGMERGTREGGLKYGFRGSVMEQIRGLLRRGKQTSFWMYALECAWGVNGVGLM